MQECEVILGQVLTCWLLFGQAEGVVRTTFEWGRIQQNADWILPIGVCVGLMLFVRVMYHRDAVELHPLLGWFLSALRTATFLGLLILYLQPQWRTEQEKVINSKALILVDTSMSMGLADGESTTGGGKSRIQQVATALEQTDLLKQLRKTHDVVVMQFSENLDRDRVHSFGKIEQDSAAANEVDWHKSLALCGTTTGLGLALQQLIDEASGSPVSGIIVFTDGGQNAGIAPEVAAELAKRAGLPIFPVGVGSDKLPANVRLSDLAAPTRAYPGDSYTVTGFIQAQELAGQVVEVQLLSRESTAGAASEPGTGQIEQRRQVTLGSDGEVLPVKFELTPEKTGRRTLCFRVETPRLDRNPDDNFREVDVEVVDRKNRVLLLAGGPTREYRFLRTLLYRDRSTTVDVLLQAARPGISQEADNLLDDFPATREEMFEYDCLVAFDPDWQALSAAQVDLLETWVAEQGGGLILIAGPVLTGNTIGGWVEDPAMAGIRALYPVEFHRRFSVLEQGMYTAEEPWPLEFTREGLEAEFLWLCDTAAASRQAWAGFEGVYSHCPVRGPKPGATVLGRFSDPRTGGDEQPVFFAGQFYGSGRVFFIGSGEMWRLRKVDETYFEQFYTKLIRHVSQSRLLRGSSRGVLLVGQDRYLLGGTVEIRAQLTNARLEPLGAPSVNLKVVLPDGTVQTVKLQPDPGREGTYCGRFPVLEEGSYRLELPVPESDNERLSRRIQVKVPDLERENPRRNDALLSRIAKSTGGKYYVGLEKVFDTSDEECIVKRFKDRTKTIILTAAPNPLWEQTWLRWMMLILCGLLCFEWLIRRLVKLA